MNSGSMEAWVFHAQDVFSRPQATVLPMCVPKLSKEASLRAIVNIHPTKVSSYARSASAHRYFDIVRRPQTDANFCPRKWWHIALHIAGVQIQ